MVQFLSLDFRLTDPQYANGQDWSHGGVWYARKVHIFCPPDSVQDGPLAKHFARTSGNQFASINRPTAGARYEAWRGFTVIH